MTRVRLGLGRLAGWIVGGVGISTTILPCFLSDLKHLSAAGRKVTMSFQRKYLLPLLLVMIGMVSDPCAASVSHFEALTINGIRVHPLEAGRHKAIVLLFIAHDCPISNSYAPEVKRLITSYKSQGVEFYTVYAEPDITAHLARLHALSFGYTCPALLDQKNQLSQITGATVTPEAAIYTPDGRRRYLGRIDDRYAGYGLRREIVRSHDLKDALDAILTDKPVPHPTTLAIGCFIPLLRKE